MRSGPASVAWYKLVHLHAVGSPLYAIGPSTLLKENVDTEIVAPTEVRSAKNISETSTASTAQPSAQPVPASHCASGGPQTQRPHQQQTGHLPMFAGTPQFGYAPSCDKPTMPHPTAMMSGPTYSQSLVQDTMQKMLQSWYQTGYGMAW